MSDDQMNRLVQIRLAIEAHETAAWLLKREADELRAQLAATGWKPPKAVSQDIGKTL